MEEHILGYTEVLTIRRALECLARATDVSDAGLAERLQWLIKDADKVVVHVDGEDWRTYCRARM